MFRLPNFDAMYKDMAETLPNTVHCDKCDRYQTVDPAQCLRRGWPQCCGQTMVLKSKET
jgi:hypothetical protein